MPDKKLLERLIGVGYFPKELPPPFSSRSLARNVETLAKQWSAKGLEAPRTRADTFSIPRYGRNRRKISIPNPISQYYLSKHIADNWAVISAHLARSEISLFSPTIPEEADRTFDPINFEDIESRKNSILSRCGHGLSLDISRFYPTIYTHSIAWALHGKEWCKQRINTPELKNCLGQNLDDLVRKGQDGQSIGIPIGPDTSVVIAEIIGACIDRELVQELQISEPIAFRYTDDFFIGLRDGRTPERVIAVAAAALSKFELEISSENSELSPPRTELTLTGL